MPGGGVRRRPAPQRRAFFRRLARLGWLISCPVCGAFLIGIICGPACYAGAVWLKRALKYDDSLDAFGLHGVGGIVGALLTGVFATAAINPAGENASLLNQAIGLAAVIAWSGVGTFLILMACQFTTGLRVAKEEEIEGLDYTQHGETIHQ